MKVSIFMFCRNGAKTVRKAVESVLNQNYENLEFIIQDGASTDGTLEILLEYGSRIQFRSEPDSGPEEGFFRAIERCSGDIVGSCLVDEQLMEGAISDAVRFFEVDSTSAAVTRDAILTDIDGEKVGEFRGRNFGLGEYLSAEYIPHFSATFFRGDSIRDSGVLDRPWRLNCGEYEFWIRILQQGPVTYLGGFASKYAVHSDQLSRDPENILKLVKGRFEVLKELFEKTPELGSEGSNFSECVMGNAKLFGGDLRAMQDVDGYNELIEICRELIAAPEDAIPIDSDQAAVALEALCKRSFKMDLYRDSEQLAKLGNTLWPEDLRFRKAECKAYMAQDEWENAKKLLDLKTEKGRENQERLEMTFHEVAQLFESRGEIDKAIKNWDRAWNLPYPHVQSLALVARLKSSNSTLLSLLEAHDRWSEHYARRKEFLLPLDRKSVATNGRIRIGVSCSFWTAPTIKYQFLSFIDEFDSERFEFVAYSNFDDGFCGAPGISSVRLTAGKTDEEFMAIARSDELDVLIELNGHSPNHRFGAMALRCAPIQVSYLNYTATSGVREVDYLVADEIACGRDEDPYYRESVYRLPGCFFCFNYEQDDRVEPSEPPSLGRGYVTFGCFSSGGKINPNQIELFARVLMQIPNSRLVIRNGELSSVGNRNTMIAQFERAGIPKSRLEIAAGLQRRELLKEYVNVDIALDTFPYNGGNTIAEAIWQGVPIVTQFGGRFSSRYGASLLKSCGCDDMVANSSDEYVEICSRLADDISGRQEMRKALPGMMKKYGLSDTRKFAGELGAAFEEMVRRYNISRNFFRDNYGDCIGEEVRNANLFGKWVFLTTMPRSGTWFTKYVFHILNHRLCDNSRIVTPPPHLRNYEGLSLNAYHSHASNARFDSGVMGELESIYGNIEYMVDGYDFGDTLQERVAELIGSIPKTVYIYRNPLDQCISFFRHLQHHKGEYRNTLAKFDEMKTPRDFFRGGGLESYIKQFVSHYWVQRNFLDSVLMVKYEDLKRDPEEEYSKILTYSLGRPLAVREKEALAFATKVVVPENLKALERLTGGSLGGDQKKAGESHMRGGSVGGWKEHYSDSDIVYLKQILEKWKIPESCFDFGSKL